MRRGKFLLRVACVSVLALVLWSCAPSGATTTPTQLTTTQPVTTTTATKTTTPPASSPSYGGIVDVYLTTDPVGFDQAFLAHFNVPSTYFDHDELMAGDWSRGPAGTNEFTHIYGSNTRMDSKIGSLAQSWSIPEPGHMVFKLRQAIHFGLNANNDASRLVNGRELIADDVVSTFKRVVTEPSSYVRQSAPVMCDTVVITAPDKYTVDVKISVDQFLWAWSYLPLAQNIIASEVVQKYGNLKDWRNSVGTGPFILTDYVAGSSLSFTKNTKYWDKDPVGPGKGNQLPYADGVKVLIIPDPSTRQAALRTGKLDWMGGTPALEKDDATNLLNTAPQLNSLRYLSNGTQVIFMRTDKQDLPFKDKRVRQALTMAIDYGSIVSQVQRGDGEYPGFPTASIPDYRNTYVALKDAPAAVQALFTYSTDKAKQLLSDAGYPNGFKTKILCDATGGIYIDQLSVIKSMWAKIGVDVSIDSREFVVYTGLESRNNYDELLYRGSGSYGIYIRFLNFVGTARDNGSYIKDDVAAKAKSDCWNANAAGDEAKVDQTYKQFAAYAMEQAWMIPWPRPYNYTLWWPWLKNYHGELNVGFDNGFYWTKWVWIDQDMKASLTGH